MKHLKLLSICVMAWALVACGGAGGADPLVNTTALHTSAPAVVTLAVGAASSNFTIGGGSAPYTASSSNTGIASVSVSGSTMVITGVSAGSAQITVQDKVGTSVSTSVTVGAGNAAAIYILAPGSLTVTAGTAATYSIGGGTPPYVAASGNNAVAVANIVNGNNLSIAGAAAGGPTEVAVYDANGGSASVNVTVVSAGSATALYTSAPAAITLTATSTRRFTIGGGAGPYTATSSNIGVVTTSVTGSTLNLNAVAGGNASVDVRDSANAKVSLSVTVSAASALFTTAPASVTVHVGSAQTYTIGGGTPPYASGSSDTGLASTSVSGATLTITGIAAGGPASVVVLDSTGAQQTISVTVGAGSAGVLFTTAPPSGITIATGATPSYSISGGTPPYVANSSNVSFVTGNVSGSTLNIVGKAAGPANVAVTDSVGGVVSIAVTVTPVATTPLAVLPGGPVTANVGDVLNFIISGASPPYGISVNNPSIASVSASSVATSGDAFSVTLRNVGGTSVSIVDQLGQSATLSLSVQAPSALLRLSPSAVQVAEDFNGAIVLSVYGGTGPYTAYTSDLRLSTVAINGTLTPATFTVSAGLNGTRCINPVNGGGAYIVNGLYPITLTVVDSLGASATSVLTIEDNGRGLTLSGC